MSYWLAHSRLLGHSSAAIMFHHQSSWLIRWFYLLRKLAIHSSARPTGSRIYFCLGHRRSSSSLPSFRYRKLSAALGSRSRSSASSITITKKVISRQWPTTPRAPVEISPTHSGLLQSSTLAVRSSALTNASILYDVDGHHVDIQRRSKRQLQDRTQLSTAAHTAGVALLPRETASTIADTLIKIATGTASGAVAAAPDKLTCIRLPQTSVSVVEYRPQRVGSTAAEDGAVQEQLKTRTSCDYNSSSAHAAKTRHCRSYLLQKSTAVQVDNTNCGGNDERNLLTKSLVWVPTYTKISAAEDDLFGQVSAAVAAAATAGGKATTAEFISPPVSNSANRSVVIGNGNGCGKRSANWRGLLRDPLTKRSEALIGTDRYQSVVSFGFLNCLRQLSTVGSDTVRTAGRSTGAYKEYEVVDKIEVSVSSSNDKDDSRENRTSSRCSNMPKRTTAPAAAVESAFPEAALLPKQETGAQAFLAKHPTYDGRGVVIAIFDTGVDPRAAGLQVTTDGKPKVIQMFNSSGAGDVDMRTQVTPENGIIKGISGRSLRIPDSWINPSGKYRIGLKSAFELYPKQLKERMQKDYKEKNWSGLLQRTLAKVTKKLQRLETDAPNEKILKEELEARVEVLTKMDKNYIDLGPVYDCLLWHDGTSWKAVLDTTEEGDLDKCEVVGPYAETLKVSVLLAEDNFSYSVNVYDDGDILEIVVTVGAHGTHVASIAAANFPDNPARNGVAPGAQIVSITLSDNRIGTMETGTSLYRAMAAVMKNDIDVINMSYGEVSKWCKGRIWEYLEEMINKRGVTMMVSANNRGPALSTLGTPPTQNAVGVGAVVTPHMMEAEYSLREKSATVEYNWTSRGPGIDGRQGATICAPGAAITSVPPYMLQGSQLMSGTSMASPNAAGVAALLISAMKQNGIKGSPYMLKRALENSAVKFSSYDPFTHGQGLVQVERAWDWILSVKNEKENLLRFELKADANMRGIYLRELYETSSPQIKSIRVQPVFVNEKQVPHKLKTSYDQNFTLSCDASWVQIPTVLNMMYQERMISIKVDPTGLEENQAHFTQIEAFESGKPDKGPVFRIPVTVIKPQKLPTNTNMFTDKVVLRPGMSNRCFLVVPSGATWALIKLKSLDAVNPGQVSLHTVQLEPDASFLDNSTNKMPYLQPLGEMSCAIPVIPNRTLEICLNKWWTSFGEMQLAWSIQFFGLTPNMTNLYMASGEGLRRIDVCASLGPEEVNPSISLKQHVIVLKPSKSKISPGDSRDTIPEGRIVYAATLTYVLNLVKGGEAIIGTPLLHNYLYESEFCSQLWMLYDQNKQLIASGDAFPDRYAVKLEKGEYVILTQIRHEDRTLLEKVTQDLSLQVIMKLGSTINLDVYCFAAQGMIQGKKASAITLPAGHVKPYYIGHVPSDKLPKGAASGHYLQGTLTLTTDEQGKSAATFPFRYFLNELSSKKKAGDKDKGDKDGNGQAAKDALKDKDNGSSPKESPKEFNRDYTSHNGQSGKEKEKKTTDEEFEEAACDFCATHLVRTGGAAVDAMYQDLIKRNPQANQMILAKIHFLAKKDKEHEDKDEMSKREEVNKQIIGCAEQVLVNINPEKLLLSFGCRQDKSDLATCKQLEKQKQLVVDVLTKKGEALCNLLTLKQTQSPSSAPDDALRAKVDEVYTELQRWVDPLNDVKTASFIERYLNITDQPGKLIRLLMRIQEDKATIETENKLLEAYKKLNWQHCIKLSQRRRLNKFSPIYRPF